LLKITINQQVVSFGAGWVPAFPETELFCTELVHQIWAVPRYAGAVSFLLV